MYAFCYILSRLSWNVLFVNWGWGRNRIFYYRDFVVSLIDKKSATAIFESDADVCGNLNMREIIKKNAIHVKENDVNLFY